MVMAWLVPDKIDQRKTEARGLKRFGAPVLFITERTDNGVAQANGDVAVEPRMGVVHVANAVLHLANLPLDANVQFMTVMATKMPFVGRG